MSADRRDCAAGGGRGASCSRRGRFGLLGKPRPSLVGPRLREAGEADPGVAREGAHTGSARCGLLSREKGEER
jgi:hypothetical protein